MSRFGPSPPEEGSLHKCNTIKVAKGALVVVEAAVTAVSLEFLRSWYGNALP